MKILFILLSLLFFISCSETKKANTIQNQTTDKSIATNNHQVDSTTIIQSKIAKPATFFEIVGNYILDSNDADCKFNLTLYYKNDQLRYKLTTNTRKLANKAEIKLNENKDGYYITFKNIEWSENEGTLNNDNEDKEIALPSTVQGVLYKNEITIQNSGNAMNYYVKIGECDLKYIHLIKQ